MASTKAGVRGAAPRWRRPSPSAPPCAAGDWRGKRANADYVRQQFGLAVSRGPIFGLVARLVHQKGIDLVLSAADEIVAAGGQIVVTGSGEPALEQALIDAHRRRPDAIGVTIGFNDGQARRIFAGSDFTLMPSRVEPWGLRQMYAQRFGSLPIGHQTGGLAETIRDGETGFLFSQPSIESFLGSIRRAFSTFAAEERLDSMRRNAISRSFSWDISAACYNALYRKALAPSACRLNARARPAAFPASPARSSQGRAPQRRPTR